MRAVVQRAARASVRVGGEVIGEIGPGLVVLLGVGEGDDSRTSRALAEKVRTLRIFPDDSGAMNRSVEEAAGEILVVSQFTLYGDARRGRRPSFIAAAPPELAEPLCQAFVGALREHGLRVAEGRFRTTMAVELVNDGPVTILLDSGKTF